MNMLVSHCSRSWEESQAETSDMEISKKNTKKNRTNKIKKNKRMELMIALITKKITTINNKTPNIAGKLILKREVQNYIIISTLCYADINPVT